jgi:hypothetical protein
MYFVHPSLRGVNVSVATYHGCILVALTSAFQPRRLMIAPAAVGCKRLLGGRWTGSQEPAPDPSARSSPVRRPSPQSQEGEGDGAKPIAADVLVLDHVERGQTVQRMAAGAKRRGDRACPDATPPALARRSPAAARAALRLPRVCVNQHGNRPAERTPVARPARSIGSRRPEQPPRGETRAAAVTARRFRSHRGSPQSTAFEVPNQPSVRAC